MIVEQFDDKTNTLVLVVKGRFDYSCQQAFRESFLKRSKQCRFVVDLSQVNYIDSSALGMLLLLRDHAGGNKGEVVLTGARDFVENALRMARFERLFTLG
ncbi:STAS domain-containing protein [Rhodanobacter aciditrophus]|uniref:STAS domain-containing protein n=1 Tax=Rhodanobacter aciditrophus TaxID=1623218 RepID=A0ABW4B3Y6_9GAMM